jgi:hypothetical protein
MKISYFLLHPSGFPSVATAPKALSSFFLHTSDFISLPLNPKSPKICECVGLTLFTQGAEKELGSRLGNEITAEEFLDELGTWPVARKARNELDLYDMSGNVWEWCWDLGGSCHGISGAAWNNPADLCAVSYRIGHLPVIRKPNIGLRLARSL